MSWRTQGQHSRRCLRPSRPGFSAAWIWRLESIDRSSNRIYGKGKCRLHTFRTVRTTAQLTEILTPVSALSLLVFCLLYTPCVAAVASIKRELGGRWAAGVVVSQCVIAWLAAFVVHGFALLFGM